MQTKTRRTRPSALLGALALVACAVSSIAKETPKQLAAQRTITSLYVVADRAVVKKDINTALKQMAPEFTAVMRDGSKRNLAQYKAFNESFVKDPRSKFTACKTRIEKFQWRGANVSVWTTTVLNASFSGMRVQTTSQMRDDWRPSPRGWLIVQSTELKTRTLMNGRAIS